MNEQVRYWILLTAVTATALAAGPSQDPPVVRRKVTVSAQVSPASRTDPRSGQTVKTVVVTPRVVESRVIAPQPVGEDGGTTPVLQTGEIHSLVQEMARKHDVSPALVESVILVESNYNSRAVSPKGAQGLMQLMPETARRFGVENSFDPRQNVEGGVKYLKFLQETFKDDRLAIAAYNAGEGAVSKYGNVPPYAETMDYVAKVGRQYGKARRNEANADAKAAQAPADSGPKAPEYRHLTQVVGPDGKVYLNTQ